MTVAGDWATGDWDLVIDSPLGRQEALVSLRAAGDQLTGTVHNKTANVTAEIFDGAVVGNTLTWKMKMTQVKMTLTFTTTVDDDTMAGKVKAGMFGSFAVSGRRC